MRLEQVRKLKPLDRFIYWMRERESIRLKREAGKQAPWTDDPILQQYRFTNCRRMDDRVSVWLLDNWYDPYFNHRNMLLAIAAARFFNLPSTLARLGQHLFSTHVNWSRVHQILVAQRKLGPLFNAAYMVRGGKEGGDKLKEVLFDYVKPLYDNPPDLDRDSMEKSWLAIKARHGFGSFMAGQSVADCRWAMAGEWLDRNTWAPVGPGSSRGLCRLLGLPLTKGMKQDTFLQELTKLRRQAEKRLPKELTCRLEMMDWQNVCCEVDKYSRALLGEGRPKQLYKTRQTMESF